MTSPAAIQGDYTDLRFVKGRKVCQVVIELPIEAGGEFVKIFGTPNPATGIPIALARIDPNAKPERKGGPLARRAGILCSEGAFQRFVAERVAKMAGAHPIQDRIDADDIATYVRWYCGIESRADLDHNPEAADKFRALDSEYTAWRVIA